MKPDDPVDEDLSVTRDPTPSAAPAPPPLPEMSDADETVASGSASTAQPQSHGSLPPLPPPPDDAPAVPGYHLLHKLGEGGMGVVWKAVQLATRREVALKLLSPAAFGSDTARLRFQREVELAARLEHPFVARVYDSSSAPGSQDANASGGSSSGGLVYYAMELVPGQDLETHVRGRGLKPKAILRLMRDVCLGMQHAHQRGVIHRDLKPSNIMVVPPDDGEASVKSNPTGAKSANASESGSRLGKADTPKIVDFGLAKTITPEDGQVTLSHAGQVAGTPAYMSPEQAAGRTDAIDTRTDVYALGVILYRLLTGKYPHDTTVSFADLLRHISDDDVIRPRAASEDASKLIDRELETLLLKALEKDPDRRYDNAGALAADLDNYLNNNPLNARPASVSYVIRKRIAKYRVPLGVAAGCAMAGSIAAGAYAWTQYNQKIMHPVETTPPGAMVVLNGVPQLKCGMTPCVIELPRGTHQIRIEHPTKPYAATERTIHVAWGKTSGQDYEKFVLLPEFRTIELRTEPASARLVLTPLDDPDAPPVLVDTPATSLLPAGRYRVSTGDASQQLTATKGPGTEIELVPGLEPLELAYRIEPAK
ncbi:MAG: serine/threonine-protein kinase [Planctomycetota bacterium]